ncbi:gamma-glutamyl-gamma-aminobutyrate hydrolase family protein [Ectobacillus panaciterrae]|uniref:gamma-glutamyl-gamma-aminobutyrate hydrolase family protein n=1 Tax=Ectobacillus panaciterrae TaxID=363872 RepID=UPI0004131D13|nr:gamma-glutamyl-gamma-aminobutyrate hydrolase family protein [Ectobacillus panaciterrae]
MKPFIGISGNIISDQGKRFPSYKRAYASNDYVEAVTLAGGVPVIMPIVEDKDLIKQQAERIDGLILSGGQDVDPLLYGEEPSQKLGSISPKRDVYEQHLIQFAIQKKKPILAICRGMQILNVTCGGTLYQDISLIDGASIEHNQRASSNIPTHSVSIKEGTHLYRLYGEQISTNSFHHQAVKKVALGFRVAALSKDGVIEAIEKEGDHFVVGVQWHPEMMAKEHEYMLNLFKLFIEQQKFPV